MNDHDKGMAAARKFAGWHLGDRSWADSIIAAYLNPERANEILNEEMEEYK